MAALSLTASAIAEGTNGVFIPDGPSRYQIVASGDRAFKIDTVTGETWVYINPISMGPRWEAIYTEKPSSSK